MPEPSRIIAVEEHFLTDRFIDAMEHVELSDGEAAEARFIDAFSKNEEMRRRTVDLGTRIAEMDASGTDIAVLSLNPPGVQRCVDAGVATALAREMNDTLAQMVAANPTRFAGLGRVAPQDPSAAAGEVRRIVGPLGLGGVLIGSHTLGHYLDEERFEPILAALEETGAPLYLHPRVPSPRMLAPFERYGMLGAVWGFQAEAGTHAMRLILSGALDRHPGLRIVLGHCGEALPFWMWRLDNTYRKAMGWGGTKAGMVELELEPSRYLRRNFAVTTSGMNDPDVLRLCIGKLGAENVMFAIDYPYEDSAPATEFLRSAPLDEGELELISHRNAERIFAIPPREG